MKVCINLTGPKFVQGIDNLEAQYFSKAADRLETFGLGLTAFFSLRAILSTSVL